MGKKRGPAVRLSTFFFIAIVFLMREKETKGFKSKNGKKQSVRKKEKQMWRYRSNHLEGKSFKWIFTKDPPIISCKFVLFDEMERFNG